jgi:hypothetical protein
VDKKVIGLDVPVSSDTVLVKIREALDEAPSRLERPCFQVG